MLKDEIIERRLKAKKLKEKEERRMKNFKREIKTDQIKKQKQMEDVVMNEKKRTANYIAIEEKNKIELKKLADKNEKARQIERRKKELEIEREVKQKNASSVQALTRHYQNQIGLIKNQLDSVRFENYIVETAQKEQISKMKQDIREKYKAAKVY